MAWTRISFPSFLLILSNYRDKLEVIKVLLLHFFCFMIKFIDFSFTFVRALRQTQARILRLHVCSFHFFFVIHHFSTNFCSSSCLQRLGEFVRITPHSTNCTNLLNLFKSHPLSFFFNFFNSFSFFTDSANPANPANSPNPDNSANPHWPALSG